MSTFDSTKQQLPKILDEIIEGKIQLPDFQRGWIWDDNHVQSLLVSIARSFPVGAVMLLETGGDIRFQTRPIENVSFNGNSPEPEKLILDGQQRLTSLTQVLRLNGPVHTQDEKGKAIRRYYYLDIQTSLEEGQIEEAFLSVDESKQQRSNFGRDVTLDLSTTELECTQLYFPCNQILNSDAWEESLQEYAPQHFGIYMQFRKKILNAFRGYDLPIIALKKETTKEAVCLVFEKVNTGGVPLSVFELITATYAADSFNLRDDWFGNRQRKMAGKPAPVEGRAERLASEPVVAGLASTDFLQAITLLHTLEKRQQDIADGKTGKSISAVSAKRVSVLNLPLAAYQKWADKVERGFMLAAKFLRKECFYTARDLPYRTQLVPLATILTLIDNRWLEPKIYDKLARWYWCGVLGELYGGAVETRIANDLEEMLRWIENYADEPRTVSEAAFQPDRLHTLRSRLSAAYKGLNVLVLREGAEDFFWKATVTQLDLEELSMDIHHIFPKAWCQTQGIPASTYDSIINKTPISAKANRKIGGNAPAIYLHSLQAEKQVGLSDAQMDALLATHLIDPAAMRANDFERFYQNRKLSLIKLIESAMGKTILMDGNSQSSNDNEEYDGTDFVFGSNDG
jgi:hypothetical protein